MESLIVRQKVGKRRRSPPPPDRSLWMGEAQPLRSEGKRLGRRARRSPLMDLFREIGKLGSALGSIPARAKNARSRRILQELAAERAPSSTPAATMAVTGLLTRALSLRIGDEAAAEGPEQPNHSRTERRILRLCLILATAGVFLGLGLGIISVADASVPLPSGGLFFSSPSGAPDLLSSLEAGQAADDSGPESGMILQELPLSLSISTHVLDKGQTIDAVAKRYGLSRDSLISMNGIVNVKRIQAGSILKIPNMDGVLHTVKKGEGLSAIASRYKTDRIGILDANDLDTDILHVGQVLFIPGGRLDKLELKRALGEQIFAWPVRGRISSNYGTRLDPFTGQKSFHKGIDIVGAWASPIKAALDGRVEETGYSPLYGNYIIISHDGGFQTSYCHLSSINAVKGRWVAQGAVVGKMGSTGYSTGTHLHFAVYRHGASVNPFNFLGK